MAVFSALGTIRGSASDARTAIVATMPTRRDVPRVPTYSTEARRRMLRQVQGVRTPFFRQLKQMMVGFGLAIAAGFATTIATRDPLLGTAVSLLLSSAVAIIAWLPFGDPRYRRAAELFYDHNCHELAEWKAKSGTPMPRDLRAVER